MKAPLSTEQRQHQFIRPIRQREHRPSASKRGYDARWRKASEAFIKQEFIKGNIFCAWCGKLLSDKRDEIHVDHVEEVIDGQNDPRFWIQENWQLLHAACHSEKTKANGKKRKDQEG